MTVELFKPREVDLLLRLPFGRAAKLAREGKLPHIVLPDGEIRFIKCEIETLLEQKHQRKENALCSQSPQE
jgi:predicted site-specific integrase-resolvase